MMVKVKICGITNAGDALFAARAGADALGFNFVKGTLRYIPPEKVKPIVLDLPPFVATVGVFANRDPSDVREIVESCALDYAQLHGRETPQTCDSLRGIKLVKAFRVRTEKDLDELGHYDVEAYLLDAFVRGVLGGTGESFDWRIARRVAGTRRVILAGGLTPENVVEAVEAARPYGVDVASGVEEEPGKKSKQLVEDFIRLAKSVDL
jgi:phosphoribosylanthranilate isomerase